MTQPNCYWTLNTPFFTMIGLYTNVPSGGVVKEPQVSWFNDEMKKSDKHKKLIVAMHHPIHSVAKNVSHRGSQEMAKLLADACNFSGRVPELVLAGHVHNYQRFAAKINGKDCTFIVAGCGGPWSAWQSLGGVITSDPGVIDNSDGRLEVFARGADNALWHIWQTAPHSGPWSGRASLGGVLLNDALAA